MIVCNIDGSISINPGGKMGIGVIIKDNNDIILELHKEYPANPENSNNCAEYIALQECLKWLLECGYADDKILIKSDSQLLINQCLNIWGIKPISEGIRFNKKHNKRDYYNENSYYRYAVTAKEQMKEFYSLTFD